MLKSKATIHTTSSLCNDIRLSYGKLFSNAFNAGNLNHYNNLLDIYADTTLTFRKNCIGDVNYWGKSNKEELSGLVVLKKSAEVFLEAFPDAIWKIYGIKASYLPHVPSCFANFYQQLFEVGIQFPELQELIHETNERDRKPGYILFARDAYSATQILESECHELTCNLSTVVYRPNTIIRGYLILVLNCDSKIIRYEYYYSH